MQVTYIGPHPEVRLPDGTLFPQGEPVEVDDATGRGLLRQPGFTTASRRRRRPRPPAVETPERDSPDTETRGDAVDQG